MVMLAAGINRIIQAWLFALTLLIALPAQAQFKIESKPYELINELTTQPQFPGGQMALDKFLCDSLVYPQLERDNDIQGKVLVRFMIDEKGDIKFPEIV